MLEDYLIYIIKLCEGIVTLLFKLCQESDKASDSTHKRCVIFFQKKKRASIKLKCSISQSWIIDYPDAEYLFNQHKAQLQMDYLFTSGGTIIFWYSMNRILLVTSSNWEKYIHQYSEAPCTKIMLHI